MFAVYFSEISPIPLVHNSICKEYRNSRKYPCLFSFKFFNYRPAENTSVKKEKKEPMIKKPPRKSKLPEPVSKTQQPQPSQQQNNNNNTVNNFRAEMNAGSSPGPSRRFKKNGEESNNESSTTGSGPTSLNSDSNSSANNLPSLTSKRFKMLRLKKDCSGELGIIISKKRHPQKGTTGYIIAHVEPGGLVER